MSPTSTVSTSTFASSLRREPRPTPPNTLNLSRFNEPLDAKNERLEKLSPNEKLSQKLISPNLVQSVRCSPSVVHNVEGNVLTPPSTVSETEPEVNDCSSNHNLHQNISNFNNLSTAASPTLSDVKEAQPQNVKTPPPPPPRWAKPAFERNHNDFNSFSQSSDVPINQVKYLFFYFFINLFLSLSIDLAVKTVLVKTKMNELLNEGCIICSKHKLIIVLCFLAKQPVGELFSESPEWFVVQIFEGSLIANCWTETIRTIKTIYCWTEYSLTHNTVWKHKMSTSTWAWRA